MKADVKPVPRLEINLDNISKTIELLQEKVAFEKLAGKGVQHDIDCLDGKCTSRCLHYSPEIAVADVWCEEGTVIANHNHEELEIIEVQKGRMRVRVLGIIKTVEAGHSISFPPLMYHQASFPVYTELKVTTIPACRFFPHPEEDSECQQGT